jgi:hypothetical protein
MLDTEGQHMDQAAIQEALRRRAGLGDSGAGIPGGMPASNAQTPGNPIAQAGVASSSPQPSQASPFTGFPTGNQTSALAQAKPGTASIIVKSLLKYLDKLPPEQ